MAPLRPDPTATPTTPAPGVVGVGRLHADGVHAGGVSAGGIGADADPVREGAEDLDQLRRFRELVEGSLPALLGRVLRATNDGWWDADLVAGTATHSDRWWRIHGHEPGELEDTITIGREPTHPEGAPVRVSGALTDTSDIVEGQRLQEAFVATVSHEQRTLIDDLLDLEALAGERSAVTAGAEDLGLLVHDAVEPHAGPASTPGVRLAVTEQPEAPLKVRIDPRSHGGTGLGLAITREIAERAGGEVGYASRPVRTSVFVELPLDEPERT